VAAIMSAHVAVPALDDTQVFSKKSGLAIPLPATLSRKIIQGQLRHSLHYQGLIISDSLCMKAISEHFGLLDAVKSELLAGIDIVTMPLSVRNPSEIMALEQLLVTLEKEMECNSRFKQQVDEALQRVVFTKLSQQLSPQPPDLTEALATVGSAAHQKISQMIAQKAVTLIKNDGVLPIDCRTQPRLLWLSHSAASHEVVKQAIQRING
jgi:beta-N-acetylhexosaminidase